ncbi:hypothetical protein DIPPA_21965 [Diplonema papillatum]|nr:hypothetical protein DIPPA_21965 [Diplonema papillatum]
MRWRQRFSAGPISDRCTGPKTTQTPVFAAGSKPSVEGCFVRGAGGSRDLLPLTHRSASRCWRRTGSCLQRSASKKCRTSDRRAGTASSVAGRRRDSTVTQRCI